MISLLLPTRGRPKLAQRFLESVFKTALDIEDIEVIICVDEDDIDSHFIDYPGVNITRIISPRATMGEYNTKCFDESSGSIIMLANDDMIIRTLGWDNLIKKLDNSIPDKIYLAYGNDLYKKDKLCAFPILSRRACEALINPYHLKYKAGFIDYHLMDIFKRLEKDGLNRIHYLDNIIFEHLHFRTGKSEVDDTYLARGRFDDDHIFIGLKNVRRFSKQQLKYLIGGNILSSELPDIIEINMPKNIFTAVIFFAKTFMLDEQLPFRWRIFMWWWFTARNIYSRFFKS